MPMWMGYLVVAARLERNDVNTRHALYAPYAHPEWGTGYILWMPMSRSYAPSQTACRKGITSQACSCNAISTCTRPEPTDCDLQQARAPARQAPRLVGLSIGQHIIIRKCVLHPISAFVSSNPSVPGIKKDHTNRKVEYLHLSRPTQSGG